MPVFSAAGTRPAPVRSLAVNALALTGAAFSVLTPARAVTLGEVAVESRLGQPFAARVPVQLAQGEMLGAACVTVPAGTTPDLAALPSPVVSVPEASTPGTYQLRVTTAQPLYEPMYELQLQVRCPGTALVVRQYVLMLDLPATAAAQATTGATATVVSAGPAVAATVPVTAAPADTATPAPRNARPRAVPRPTEPIVGGTRYRVSAGDTLSTIAARIGGTGESLWARADRIFAANPDAFIGGNPDLIKLGSEIVIPAPGVAPAAADAPATPAVATAEAAPAALAVPAAVPATDPLAAVPPVEATAPVAEVAAAEALADAARSVADTFDPLAADVAAEGDVPVDAVFQDEQPVVEPLVESEPVAEALPGAAPARESGETSPWLAALVGVLVGAIVSVGLLRERLLEALRGLKPGRRAVTTAGVAGTAPVARRAASPESTMVVIEGHLDEDTDQLLAQSVDRTDENPAPVRPVATKPRAERGNDPASDLSRLFEDPPTAAVADELAADLPAESELDLDLSAATPDVTIDQEIAWIGDDTALTPTQEFRAPGESGADTVENLDLQTLSQRATSDTQVSQTLEEALNLLESDYEDELTASQVIDHKKLKEILDEDASEDTLVRTGTDQIPRR